MNTTWKKRRAKAHTYGKHLRKYLKMVSNKAIRVEIRNEIKKRNVYEF